MLFVFFLGGICLDKEATRNKCIATSNKCLTSSNKKLLETRMFELDLPSSSRTVPNPVSRVFSRPTAAPRELHHMAEAQELPPLEESSLYQNCQIPSCLLQTLG